MFPAGLLVALLLAQAEGAAGREQMRLCLEKDGDDGLAACRKALATGLTALHAGITQDALSRKLIALLRFQEAEAALGELVRLRTKDPEAWLRLGELRLHSLGRAEDAIPPLEESIRLKGDSAEARASLGLALAALGRLGPAADAFREALGIDPRFFETRPASRQIFEAAERGEAWPAAASGDPKH